MSRLRTGTWALKRRAPRACWQGQRGELPPPPAPKPLPPMFSGCVCTRPFTGGVSYHRLDVHSYRQCETCKGWELAVIPYRGETDALDH